MSWRDRALLPRRSAERILLLVAGLAITSTTSILSYLTGADVSFLAVDVCAVGAVAWALGLRYAAALATAAWISECLAFTLARPAAGGVTVAWHVTAYAVVMAVAAFVPAHLANATLRLRMLAENASDVVLRIGPDNRIDWCSPSVRRQLSWSNVSLTGTPWSELVHPDDQDLARAAVQRSGGPATVRVRRRDASFSWMTITGTVIGSEPSTRILVIGLHDANEQVAATRQLQESELRYRVLSELADVVRTSGDDPKSLLGSACRYLAGALGGVWVMALVDRHTPTLRPVAAAGMLGGIEAEPEALPVTAVGTGIAGVVARTGQLIELTDVSLSSAGLTSPGEPEPAMSCNLIVLPLACEERVVGTMAFAYNIHDGSLTASVRGLLTEAANRLADAVLIADLRSRIADHETRLRSMVANATVGMGLFDLNGTITAANPALCRMVGKPPTEVVGQRLSEFTHPSDRKFDAALLAGIAANPQQTQEVELRFLRQDGSVVWVRGHLSGQTEGDGLVGVAGQYEDITAERLAAEVVATAERTFRLAMANAPIGMALVGLDGTFLDVNGAVCRLTGYSREALLDCTFQDITHPDDVDTDVAQLRQLIAGEIADYRMQKRYIKPDGTITWAELQVTLVRDDAGAPQYFISQIVDINEVRQVTAELRQANQELSEIVAFTSDEVKLPLQHLRELTSCWRDLPGLPADAQARLSTIATETSMVQDKLQSLLTYAQVDSRPLRRASTDLAALVSDVASELHRELTDAGCELRVTGTLPVVRGDTDQLRLLLIQLMRNSLQYRSPQRRLVIDVAASVSDDFVTVSLMDNGVGIPACLQPQVFAALKSLDCEDGHRPGLGLATCRKIVDRHGGTVWIADSDANGTVIRFTLANR